MAQTYSDKPTLEAWNALAEAASGAGNCKIIWGSYAGTGTYGVNSPKVFEHLEGVPRFLFVRERGASEDRMIAVVHGTTNCEVAPHTSPGSLATLSWGSNWIIWYAPNAELQMNASGKKYAYIILMLAQD